MKIMVVDDENLALSRMQRLLGELGFLQVSLYDDPTEAIKEFSSYNFDVVFLDISMPKINGLELANILLQINPKAFIIFQTAYKEYALEAFSHGGIDYLLKPVAIESLQKAMSKIQSFVQTNPSQEKKILGKLGSTLYLIDVNDIYYIKADLDEIIIRIKETQVYVRKKIGDMQQLLEGKNFFRIHRSIIVNVDKIKSMESVEQSKLQISFKDIDSVVTSSKDGAKEFREYLEQKSI